MGSNNSSKGGIGFVGLLTIVFIVLKLTGVINWPWLWVISPIWIAAGIAIIIAVVFIIILLIGFLWEVFCG